MRQPHACNQFSVRMSCLIQVVAVRQRFGHVQEGVEPNLGQKGQLACLTCW